MDYDTLVQRFVDELTRRGKARLTVKTYRSDLLVFRTWCVRNAPDVVGEVGNLRYDHILAFLRHDRVHEPLPVQPSRFNPHPTAGLPARGAHYAARTYQRKTVVLRVFCAWAESEHYLGRSPFPTNMGMKARADMGALRAAPIYLSEADMARLWAAVMAGLPGNKSWQQWRDRALFGLMLTTGVCVEEVCGISLSDGEQIVRTGGELAITGSVFKPRTVVVPTRIVRILELYMQVRPGRGTSPTLFVSTRGGSIYPRLVQRRFRDYANLAGLHPTLTPRNLRHTFATTLFREGLNVREAQELLGHAQGSTTEAYSQILQVDAQRKMRDINVFKNLQ